MKESYLVQRLCRLIGDNTPAEPRVQWSIGTDGRLSKDAMEARQKIFDYDYMGSSEFEFGAIPKVVKELVADKDKLVARQIEAEVRWVDYDSHRNSSGERSVLAKAIPIYVICRADDEAVVATRVVELLADVEHKIRLKESLHTDYAMTSRSYEKAPSIVGWLEVTNGFYFFVDKRCWQYTMKLYTGKVP